MSEDDPASATPPRPPPTAAEEPPAPVPAGATTPGQPPDDAGRGSGRRPDWGPYGRGPILLLAGVGLVDAIDKGILPGVLTRVQNDLGFSDFQLGLLEFAFVIATFLVIVPAGYLADRRRRTRIIAVVLGSWAVISAATATVRNFAQFFSVRAALGVGETVDDPASQSLIADYYPARIRGRAYSYQRVTPTLGRALGTVLGGVVAAMFGWRAAFLLVGVPGSLLALAVWRMPEPGRGEADLQDMGLERAPSGTEGPAPTADDADADEPEVGIREIFADLPKVFRIRSLRALLIGTAVASGALSGLGFWAVAFNERHSGLSGATAAAVTGGMILLGAIVGTLVGGRVADRVRRTHPGAPMVAAGIGTMLGGVALLVSFAPVPVWTVRVPLQTLGVGLLVGALPATYSMISQVASPAIRGQSFAATRFVASLVGAFSPPLIGLVADQYQITVDGQQVGNLALAFALFTPALLLGGFYIYRGRIHVEADREQAARDTVERFGVAAAPSSDPPTASITTSSTATVDAPLAPSPDGSPPPPPATNGDGPATVMDPTAQRIHRTGTWLGRTGVVAVVIGVVATVLGWAGAAGSTNVFDQVPYLVSGGLLGIALLGLGGTLVVVGRVLHRQARRRHRAAVLARAVDGLEETLRGRRPPGG